MVVVGARQFHQAVAQVQVGVGQVANVDFLRHAIEDTVVHIARGEGHAALLVEEVHDRVGRSGKQIVVGERAVDQAQFATDKVYHTAGGIAEFGTLSLYPCVVGRQDRATAVM